MKHEFQHSIKLWLFDDRILFNQLLPCGFSTALIFFSWQANKIVWRQFRQWFTSCTWDV